MTRAIGCLLLLALLALTLPALALGAENAPAEFVGIRVGFAGRYKAGVWTPVEVRIRGGSQRQAGEVRLTVPDGDGVPSRVVTLPEEPCVVPPGQTVSVGMLVRFGRTRGDVLAEFVVDGRVAARREFPSGDEVGPTRFLPAMPALQPLIVSVGAADAGIEDAVALRQAEPTRERVVAHVDGLDHLPTHWAGYEGVEAVVLSTSRPESLRDSDPLRRRLEALDRWVRQGGRLVVCAGAAAAEVVATDGPLARFAPGSFAELVPLRRLGAMESYAGGNTPIPNLEPGQILIAPRLTDVRGVIEAREADLPLVVRSARGFGQVLFVAADLDRPPLSGWRDRRLVMARLLDLPVTRPEDRERDHSVLRYTYDDLSGQLRSALDQFQGVRLVPFGAVAAVLVLYIALIGPGDYFFLKRVLRRMELTWVTFPAAVIAMSAAAYGTAYWLKGTEIRLNQADVVDVDVATGHVRGTCWFNLYSPRIDAYDLSLSPQPPFPLQSAPGESRVLLGWLGLPGQSLGGMSNRAQGPALWTDAYAFSPQLDAVMGAPVAAWATKSFTARWEAHAPATIAADLALVDDAPTGTLTNALDVPLNDCLLAFGNWAYRLGDLPPGASVSLSAESPRSELKTVLTGRRYVQEDKSLRQRITPYDRASVDPDYVVNAMLFHEAAGGTRYTDLSNAYQPFIDMSSLLRTGRAILVARIGREGKPRRATEVLRDGGALAGPNDGAVGVYRFVIPVETRPRTAGDPPGR